MYVKFIKPYRGYFESSVDISGRQCSGGDIGGLFDRTAGCNEPLKDEKPELT
jgi:hypothetical protein